MKACPVIQTVIPTAVYIEKRSGAKREIKNPRYAITPNAKMTNTIRMNPNSSADAAKMKSSGACGSQYDFWTP